MTAFAMIRLDDRIVIAADGAMYMPGGQIAAFGSKILQLPHISAALVCAGPSFLLRYLNLKLGANLSCFDDLLCEAPEALHYAYEDFESDIEWKSPFYMGLCGYSVERERFESYYLRSVDREESGAFSLPGAAWELMPAPMAFAMPWPSDEACRRVLLITPVNEGYAFDPEILAIKVIGASRFAASDGLHGEGYGVHLVGGFIEMVTIRKDLALSQIVHRWPDRIGEAIDPEDGEPLPQWVLNKPAFFFDREVGIA